ncbi:MAG TPA: DUF1697 domain-containing protein [Candidatus Polarisedimenticolaceae bacterium]|nr:DUF1697 domain-containing protein [Candidatus Polarisedimenticolaceae bacterium]
MTRYAAFLRGINVGRAKRVSMADLAGLVERLGYREVVTILNSGNVVFTAPASLRGDPGPRIERAVTDQLGVSSRVTALTSAEVNAAIEANTLLDIASNPSRLLVAILSKKVDRRAIQGLVRRDWAPGALVHDGRAAFLWCPDGILGSRLAKEFAAAIRDDATTRNWATMLRIQAALRSS